MQTYFGIALNVVTKILKTMLPFIITSARTAAQRWMANTMDDYIGRQAAIDAVESVLNTAVHIDEQVILENGVNYICTMISRLPSAQPEIIRCRNCKFASGDSRICMKFGHSPIGELDFCAWAERRTDE